MCLLSSEGRFPQASAISSLPKSSYYQVNKSIPTGPPPEARALRLHKTEPPKEDYFLHKL